MDFRSRSCGRWGTNRFRHLEQMTRTDERIECEDGEINRRICPVLRKTSLRGRETELRRRLVAIRSSPTRISIAAVPVHLTLAHHHVPARLSDSVKAIPLTPDACGRDLGHLFLGCHRATLRGRDPRMCPEEEGYR